MKLKSIIVAALAVATFASCSKDNGEFDGGKVGAGTKTVTVRAVQPDGVNVRAEGEPASGTVANFTKGGYLYFTTGTADNSVITKVMTIGDGATSDTNVDYDALTDDTPGADPVEIENVPGTSQAVYIMSNLPSGKTPAFVVNNSVAALKKFAIDVADLMPANDGGVDKVPVFGEAAVVDGATADDNATADVKIYPIAARIEVAKLEGEGDIESYKLEGIFINNYYTKQGVGGYPAAGGALVNNGDNRILYKKGSTAYPATGLPLYDWYLDNDGNSTFPAVGKVVALTGGDVWGYNVFPAKNKLDAGDVVENNMPHVIVALSDVKLTSEASARPGTWYLTLAAYKKGATAVNEFEKGKVYKLGNIKFDEKDIDIDPEPGTTPKKVVEVSVEVMKWVPEDIEWSKPN